MRIAIPLENGTLAAHFGRCDAYAFVDVDEASGEIRTTTILESPPHQPGVLPAWVARQGARVVIAGGMGPRAIQLFGSHGVEVVLGAPQAPPDQLAGALLRGELQATGNPCDHGEHPGGCGGH